MHTAFEYLPPVVEVEVATLVFNNAWRHASGSKALEFA